MIAFECAAVHIAIDVHRPEFTRYLVDVYDDVTLPVRLQNLYIAILQTAITHLAAVIDDIPKLF